MIGGETHRIAPKYGRYLGPSAHQPVDPDLDPWFCHDVAVKGGHVYDGTTGPAGLLVAGYEAQFGFALDINWGFCTEWRASVDC
jgi:hypothetical protein